MQLLVLFEAEGNCVVGFFLVVQVLPEIAYLVVELYHPLVVVLSVLQPQLVLHQHLCVKVLVVLVVHFQLLL